MPDFKKDTDGFMNKPSGFKMKGFSGFHGSSPMQKTDGSSPMTIGPNLGISADTKTKSEVQDAQDHVAGVIKSEEKRADRKERKGEKAASKGKDKKAARKQRKADKIREALAPLKRRKSEIGNSPITKKDEDKSPHEQYIALKNKIDNKTASKGDIRKFKRLQKAMGEGIGQGNYDEID